MSQLNGKVSIVTGGGSGIGRAIALKFAAEGAKVAIADMNEDGGRETLSLIEKARGQAIFVKANSSSVDDNERLVRETVAKFGALHVAVNNAGIGGPMTPVADHPIDAWDKVIAVNLSGVFYGMRAQIPELLRAGKGSIINMASVLGQVGIANQSAYVAAKHGVIGLTKNAALEYSAKGLRVNSVGPAFILTPAVERAFNAEQMAGLVAQHPIGRLGTPEEVAELCLWLASDRASFVTGSYYAIDGGYLSR